MAEINTNLFARTGSDKPNPLEGIDRKAGVIRPTGVGIREGEITGLKAIGTELGNKLGTEAVAVNALVVTAIQRFLDDVAAGRLTIDDLAKEWETPAKPKARRRQG